MRMPDYGRLFLIVLALLAANAKAASKVELEAEVQAAIQDFYKTVGAGRALAKKSVGMLVFPSVLKGGFIVGAEYGEGALLIGGKTAAYCNTASASFGLQAGAQSKTMVVLFMNKAALAQFRRSDGWKAGVDGNIAVATLGAGGEMSSETVKEPIIGFIFGNKGLMADLGFAGTKTTRIQK
jgi:lipid-binding SYLF domain-containing protein